jgi:hypothetical protein
MAISVPPPPGTPEKAEAWVAPTRPRVSFFPDVVYGRVVGPLPEGGRSFLHQLQQYRGESVTFARVPLHVAPDRLL